MFNILMVYILYIHLFMLCTFYLFSNWR